MNDDLLIIFDSTITENTPRVNQLIGVLDLLVENNINTTLIIPKLKDIDIRANFRYQLYHLDKVKIIEIKYSRIDNIFIVNNKISNIYKRILCKLLPIDCLFLYSIFVLISVIRLNKVYKNTICIGNCLSVCCVGAIIKQLHRTNNLILDMGDPFKVKNWFNSLIEQYTTDKTNTVILPTKAMKNDFIYLKNNYTVLSQIFTQKSLNYSLCTNSDYLNLFYFGRFYPGMREPYKLFDALNNLIIEGYKIKLYLFIVDFQKIYLDFLKSKKLYSFTIINTPIEREYLLGVMKQMTILINILNENSNQFPSKLLDYQTTQKPILNIGYKNSMDKFPLIGEFCLNNTKDIKKKIKLLLNNNDHFCINYSDNHIISKNKYLSLLIHE